MAFQFPSLNRAADVPMIPGLVPNDFNWSQGAGVQGGGFLPGAPTPGTVSAAGASGGGLFDGMSGFDGLKLGVAGLGTLGSLWSSFQANKLAKEQFKFTKDFAQKNLANQIASYNTALEDRSRSRAVVEGQSAETAKSYVDANRLKG